MTTENLAAIIATIITLFGGKEVIGYVIRVRADTRSGAIQAEQKRESDVITALVEMTQNQSAAQIELTREALNTLQTMVTNVTRMASVLEGHGKDSEHWFQHFQKQIDTVKEQVRELQQCCEENGERIKSLVQALVEARN